MIQKHFSVVIGLLHQTFHNQMLGYVINGLLIILKHVTTCRGMLTWETNAWWFRLGSQHVRGLGGLH